MKISFLSAFLLASASVTVAQVVIPPTSTTAKARESTPATPQSSASATYAFDDFPGGQKRIYDITDGEAIVTFSQNMADVTTIEIYRKEPITPLEDEGTMVDICLPDSATSSKGSLFTVTATGSSTMITIMVQSLFQNTTNKGEPALYYLKAGIGTTPTYVNSPLFAVASGDPAPYNEFSDQLISVDPFGSEDASLSDATSSSNSQVPIASGNSGDTDNSKTPSSNGDKSGGGGLATGAIAGIAVGAAIALILVVALVWFFIRRRKRWANSHPADVSAPLAAGYGGAAGSRDFMGEKEAGAMAAESPQSQAYTDQPDPRHSATLSGAAAAAGGVAAGPASASYTENRYQEYEDTAPVGGSPTEQQPPHHGSSERGVDSPAPGAGVTRHLVDEDMTADEIARLEEEERELDRQIQEAGRRR